jgi:hypothetical protein
MWRERRISLVRLRRPDAVAQSPVKTGETIERDGFAYTDLLPA